MESATQIIARYMLDTNCFDRILDGEVSLHLPAGTTLICTGVQRDELDRCPDPARREKLLKTFETLSPEIKLASSFCFDIEGAGWGQAYWGDNTGRFDRMLERLKEEDRKKKKKYRDPRNPIRDIVNAETALNGKMFLVTADDNLRKIMLEFGGTAISFQDFITRNSH